MKANVMFGEFFKSKRIEQGLTLREFCKKHRLDPGNLSKMERGQLKPPSGEKLEEYARYLAIIKGSTDWYTFFDRASACKGIIPEEFMNDEELIQSLPIIFRTFRNKQVTKELTLNLIERLKKA